MRPSWLFLHSNPYVDKSRSASKAGNGDANGKITIWKVMQ